MTAAAVSTMDGGLRQKANSGMGIYADFIQRVRTYYAAFSPPKSVNTCYWWSNQAVCFEPAIGRAILEDMLGQANVDLCLGTSVMNVSTSGNTVLGVVTTGGDHFNAHVTLDGTEYGDVIALSPANYRVGDHSRGEAPDPDSCVQDITYTAIARRYPNGVPQELRITSPPPGYPQAEDDFLPFVTSTGNEPPPCGSPDDPRWEYPYGPHLHRAYRGVPDSTNPANYTDCTPGQITRTGINWANDYPGHRVNLTTQAPIYNTPLPTNYIESSGLRASANCDAKLRTMQFLYYLRSKVGQWNWGVANDEGFATAYNVGNLCTPVDWNLWDVEVQMPQLPYVRESRRIEALHTLRGAEIGDGNGDLRTDHNFITSVAIGDHDPDFHNCKADATFDPTLGDTWSNWRTNYDGIGASGFQIPFESFIPEVVDGLLPSSKSVGSTRLAHSAVRYQPVEMALGQAAGVIAAVAVTEDQQPRNVSVWQVQKTLLEYGVGLSLYRFNDVPVTNPDWDAVQLAALHEMIIGDDNGNFLLDDAIGRGLLAFITAQMAEIDSGGCDYQGIFSDVPESNIFHCAIEAIFTAGITGGCATSPLRFCPENLTTRIQFTVFMVKALGLESHSYPPTPLFDDVGPGHPMFPYVQIAASQGLLAGCTTSSFCPDGSVTRRAAARVIMNSLDWRETH